MTIKPRGKVAHIPSAAPLTDKLVRRILARITRDRPALSHALGKGKFVTGAEHDERVKRVLRMKL